MFTATAGARRAGTMTSSRPVYCSAVTEEGRTLHDPLRIELDEPELAESLRRELSLFHAEIVELDGHAEVEVELITGNPEARISSTLHRIDQWLSRTGTASVRVHLDGQVYTLSAPR